MKRSITPKVLRGKPAAVDTAKAFGRSKPSAGFVHASARSLQARDDAVAQGEVRAMLRQIDLALGELETVVRAL